MNKYRIDVYIADDHTMFAEGLADALNHSDSVHVSRTFHTLAECRTAIAERRPDVLWSSVVVNVLTNVPLNLYITYVDGSIAAMVAGEVLVLVVEALWYAYFVRRWQQAFVYSFLCNGISCVAGVLVMLLLTLFR